MLTTTNEIKDTIQKNNVIFSEKWEVTHDRIDRRSEEILLLKNRVVDLKALSGLQQTALQSCQNTIARLEETVTKLAMSVTLLEKSVCCCQDRLLSPAPHYAPGEEEEMVEETEEECHRYDFLVRLFGTDLLFSKFFYTYSFGIDHDPPCSHDL